MKEELNIQWFPGHMAKARRMITEDARSVDAVCEIIDARIPVSSRNPDLDTMVGDKPRLIIINRTDQADPAATKRWAAYFRGSGMAAIETDCKSGKGTSAFSAAVRSLLRDKLSEYAARGQSGRTIRIMIVGIPNVGKSTFINRIAKRKAAAASDRPGVTRGKQWVSVSREAELLDMPGVLWPKFDDKQAALKLAFTGAVKDDVTDIESLAAELGAYLAENYPDRLKERYKLDSLEGNILETIAKKRGMMLAGGVPDTGRAAAALLDEYRGGKIGRISLERPSSS